MRTGLFVLLGLMLLCGTAKAQTQATMKRLSIDVVPGSTHLNASFALWLEDADGNFLKTIFVTRNVGTGTYSMAIQERGRWKPGALLIEGALPVWAHRRGIVNVAGGYAPSSRSAEPDALTGATPIEATRFYLRIDPSKLPSFRILLEVNQSHDFNAAYQPESAGLKDTQNIGQPSVVYGRLIDLAQAERHYTLLPLGHGQRYGQNGQLLRGLDSLDTALHLFEKVSVTIHH